MSEEILVNVTPKETRVAIVENGILQENHIKHHQKREVDGQNVIDLLLDNEANSVADLGSLIDRLINFQVGLFYTQEQYNIALL